jgi:hypothetical protein
MFADLLSAAIRVEANQRSRFPAASAGERAGSADVSAVSGVIAPEAADKSGCSWLARAGGPGEFAAVLPVAIVPAAVAEPLGGAVAG